MSFVDSIKHIEQLSIIDEFGGRGNAGKINTFHIILRVTDENGNSIEISLDDIKRAASNGQIILSDYIGLANYSVGINEDTTKQFIIKDSIYKYHTNIITLSPSEFTGDISLSVKFRANKDDEKDIASTAFLSDFPSTFFLSRSSE